MRKVLGLLPIGHGYLHSRSCPALPSIQITKSFSALIKARPCSDGLKQEPHTVVPSQRTNPLDDPELHFKHHPLLVWLQPIDKLRAGLLVQIDTD